MFDEACFRVTYFKFSPNSTGRITCEQANRKQASESMFEKSTIAVEPKFLFQVATSVGGSMLVANVYIPQGHQASMSASKLTRLS